MVAPRRSVGTGTLEYPITAILGDRGAGKTCIMTALAYDANQKGMNVYTNFTLYDIPHTRVKGKDIKEMSDFIQDGILLIDEISKVAHSYRPFSVSSEQLVTFCAESRKRRISVFYTGQNLKQASAPLRRLTDLAIEMGSFPEPGYYQYRVLTKSIPNELIKDWSIFYGKPFWSKYDTNEIVEDDTMKGSDDDD